MRKMPHPKPADLVGAATLERISAAPAFNRWMFDRVRRWVGRRVLEIGAGIGNLSQFLADRERVALSDMEAYYLTRLRELALEDEGHIYAREWHVSCCLQNVPKQDDRRSARDEPRARPRDRRNSSTRTGRIS